MNSDTHQSPVNLLPEVTSSINGTVTRISATTKVFVPLNTGILPPATPVAGTTSNGPSVVTPQPVKPPLFPPLSEGSPQDQASKKGDKRETLIPLVELTEAGQSTRNAACELLESLGMQIVQPIVEDLHSKVVDFSSPDDIKDGCDILGACILHDDEVSRILEVNNDIVALHLKIEKKEKNGKKHEKKKHN